MAQNRVKKEHKNFNGTVLLNLIGWAFGIVIDKDSAIVIKPLYRLLKFNLMQYFYHLFPFSLGFSALFERNILTNPKKRQQYDCDVTSSSTLFLEMWCISPSVCVCICASVRVRLCMCANSHKCISRFTSTNNTAVAAAATNYNFINWQPYASSYNNNQPHNRYIIIGDTGKMLKYVIAQIANSFLSHLFSVHIHSLSSRSLRWGFHIYASLFVFDLHSDHSYAMRDIVDFVAQLPF